MLNIMSVNHGYVTVSSENETGFTGICTDVHNTAYMHNKQRRSQYFKYTKGCFASHYSICGVAYQSTMPELVEYILGECARPMQPAASPCRFCSGTPRF